MELGVNIVIEEFVPIFKYPLAYLFEIDLNLISPSCCLALRTTVKFEIVWFFDDSQDYLLNNLKNLIVIDAPDLPQSLPIVSYCLTNIW